MLKDLMEAQFNLLKKNAWKKKSEDFKKRSLYLENLQNAIKAHEAEIIKALSSDFQKPAFETLMTEIYPVLQEIQFAIKNLKNWCSLHPVSSPLAFASTQCAIQYEAKGVCLIISPWNYPFQLALAPLVAALAAGNTVILKPSEITPQTSSIIKKLISSLFVPDHVLCLEGGLEVSQQLLKLPFDHIFFTGSTQVGKIVMQAAAANLASVTLELGGKSPTIIDPTANVSLAATKIAWGKFINAGQTCVAPDYVFVHTSCYDLFINEMKSRIKTQFGESIESSPDLARIVSNKNWSRLNSILEESLQMGSQLEFGGDKNSQTRFISPTLLSQVDMNSQMMKEEIFGPLLPIIKYNHLDEVIQYIQQNPKPLSLYIFSNSSQTIDRILSETSSGGVCINETVIHLGNHYLPFGGTGTSGQGSYHGFFGFKAFSHEKAILKQTWFGLILKALYPPYKPWKEKVARFLIRWGI